MKLLLLMTLVLALPMTVIAADHESDQQADTLGDAIDPTAAPPSDADAASEEIAVPPSDENIADYEGMPPLPEDEEASNKQAEDSSRFVLFIDALKYRASTQSIETTHGQGDNQTSIASTSDTATMRALDASIGLKSYHDNFILGFGIASNLVSTSDALSGGVLIAGYQLLEGLEVGGLLYVASRSKETTTSREDAIAGSDTVNSAVFASKEESVTANSVYSFGPWVKLQAGNYWQAQFAVYYTYSYNEQKSDRGQQSGNREDTFNNLTTTVKRSFFALDLTFGPWLPITEHLTFVPQVNITWYMPLAYTQTATMSSGSSTNEETLEFNEHSSFDYALTLGGLRYEF